MTTEPTGWEEVTAPDSDVIGQLARATVAALPKAYRGAAETLACGSLTWRPTRCSTRWRSTIPMR